MQYDFQPDPDVFPQWKIILASLYILGSPPPDTDGIDSVVDELNVISNTVPIQKQIYKKK